MSVPLQLLSVIAGQVDPHSFAAENAPRPGIFSDEGCASGKVYRQDLQFQHGLIPEAVYNFTCATFEKRRRKEFDTSFGHYIYRDVPSKAYPAEVLLIIENGYSYQIATAEKAICDTLYKAAPLSNTKEIINYLFDDMRIDEKSFNQLDMKKILELSSLYRTKNHRLLESVVRKRM